VNEKCGNKEGNIDGIISTFKSGLYYVTSSLEKRAKRTLMTASATSLRAAAVRQAFGSHVM